MVNIMNQNLELLTHIYKYSEMGVFSTTTLINKIKTKENKIKTILENEIKIYEDYVKRSKKILKSYNLVPKDSNVISKISSSIGITMETLKDNSDCALSQMIIEGLTMGIVSTTTKISQYSKVVDKKVIKLAKEFIEFQEKEIEKLKTYM